MLKKIISRALSIEVTSPLPFIFRDRLLGASEEILQEFGIPVGRFGNVNRSITKLKSGIGQPRMHAACTHNFIDSHEEYTSVGPY